MEKQNEELIERMVALESEVKIRKLNDRQDQQQLTSTENFIIKWQYVCLEVREREARLNEAALDGQHRRNMEFWELIQKAVLDGAKLGAELRNKSLASLYPAGVTKKNN